MAAAVLQLLLLGWRERPPASPSPSPPPRCPPMRLPHSRSPPPPLHAGSMALFAVPIVGGVAGGAYLWASYKLASAVDSATRATLLGHDPQASPAPRSWKAAPTSGSTGQQHTLLFAAGWAVAYAAGARALRPAFSRLRVPASVDSAVQLAQSLAPGMARHAVACTAAVAAAAAGTAAYDVRLARQQQPKPRSSSGSSGSGPLR